MPNYLLGWHIEHDSKEDVLVLGVNENVLKSAGRMLVNICDIARKLMTREIVCWYCVEVWPEIERRRSFFWKLAHGRFKRRFELILRELHLQA